jgi:hypothetical protein
MLPLLRLHERLLHLLRMSRPFSKNQATLSLGALGIAPDLTAVLNHVCTVCPFPLESGTIRNRVFLFFRTPRPWHGPLRGLLSLRCFSTTSRNRRRYLRFCRESFVISLGRPAMSIFPN